MLSLAIDIGNSRVKTGIFRAGTLLSKASYLTLSEKQVADIFHQFPDIKAAVISTVAGNEQIGEWVAAHCTVLHVTKNVLLPVRLEYAGNAGNDRICAASYAAIKNPDGASLIVDAGTCITYTLVKDNIFKGGAISPGIDLRYRALNEFTANLPLLKFVNEFPSVCGESTDLSIHSGVLNGALNEVKGMIDQYQESYPGIKVFVTGGYSAFFEKALKNGIFADPDLVLKGLYHILEFNAPYA